MHRPARQELSSLTAIVVTNVHMFENIHHTRYATLQYFIAGITMRKIVSVLTVICGCLIGNQAFASIVTIDFTGTYENYYSSGSYDPFNSVSKPISGDFSYDTSEAPLSTTPPSGAAYALTGFQVSDFIFPDGSSSAGLTFFNSIIQIFDDPSNSDGFNMTASTADAKYSINIYAEDDPTFDATPPITSIALPDHLDSSGGFYLQVAQANSPCPPNAIESPPCGSTLDVDFSTAAATAVPEAPSAILLLSFAGIGAGTRLLARRRAQPRPR
jgi:hypothetical protein